jgi:PilZ domain
MEQDRSPMRGYPFFAHAELAVENSDVHVTARLCELSREGCLLYVMNPPPVGTSVLVKIYAWPHFLRVQGKVCRCDPNFRVAVAFGQIESHYVSVLNACLLEAEQKQRNHTAD